MRKAALFVFAFFCMAGFKKPGGDAAIQIDVSSILNARPVTVFTGGKLVGWKTGIDGGGKGDGYLTASAAHFNGDKTANALPDNALFTANKFHPAIQLHYYNNDTMGYQTRNVAGEGEFTFNVPVQKYSKMFLCLTSSEGPSQLQFTLTYCDGAITQNFTLPDYYDDLKPGDTTITYLAHNLAKWDKRNKMAEADHHNIDAVNIHTDATRRLKSVTVKKNKSGYLVFWGATGLAWVSNITH